MRGHVGGLFNWFAVNLWMFRPLFCAGAVYACTCMNRWVLFAVTARQSLDILYPEVGDINIPKVVATFYVHSFNNFSLLYL